MSEMRNKLKALKEHKQNTHMHSAHTRPHIQGEHIQEHTHAVYNHNHHKCNPINEQFQL